MELINFNPEQEFVTKWRDDFSNSSISDNWEIIDTNASQTISVINSELRIRSGVVANAETIIRSKKAFTIPCRVFFIYYLTQRINNQLFLFSIVDFEGLNYARFSLSGNSNTSALGQTMNNGHLGSDVNLGIPNSSAYSCLELDVGIDELKFVSKAVDSISFRDVRGSRNRKIPDPSLKYYIQIKVINTATPPASNTDLILDSVSYQSYDLISVDISTSKNSQSSNESLPVSVVSQPSVTGAVSIGDAGQNTFVTSTNLATNAIFTSSSYSAVGRNNLTVTVVVDVPGTLFIDQSFNGTTWINYPGRNCVAGVNTFNVPLDTSNYRVRYVNGSTAQTSFAIYTKTKI